MAKKKEIRLKPMTFEQSREFVRLTRVLLDLPCMPIPNADNTTFSSVKITTPKPISSENKAIYRNWFDKHHKSELNFEIATQNKVGCVTFISLKA